MSKARLKPAPITQEIDIDNETLVKIIGELLTRGFKLVGGVPAPEEEIVEFKLEGKGVTVIISRELVFIRGKKKRDMKKVKKLIDELIKVSEKEKKHPFQYIYI